MLTRLLAYLRGYTWVETRKAIAALAVPLLALAVAAVTGNVDVATSVVAIATGIAGAVAVFIADNAGRFGRYAKALAEAAVAGGAYVAAAAEAGWAWRSDSALQILTAAGAAVVAVWAVPNVPPLARRPMHDGH